MSQVLDPPVVPAHESTATGPQVQERDAREGYGKFDYQPTPISAIVGAVLAGMSLVVFVSPLPAAFLGCIATLVGGFALFRILRSQGELAGKKLALFAVIVAPLCAVAGIMVTKYRFENELPEGHRRISFTRDIAQKKIGIAEVNGVQQLQVHPDVATLVGKPIFVKGFMYPTSRTHFLTEFLLCKDNAQCCFGGEPPVTDMIGVKLGKDLSANFDPALTSVAGNLYINPNFRGQPNEPLYMMDATKVEVSQTGF